MKEDIFKTFVGGEDIACRPNYGIVTNYYNWGTTGKYWEMNLAGPSIHGDANDLETLRAFIRRIHVVNFESSYTSDLSKVDPANKIFIEDADLKKFLGSPAARLAYTKRILLPFLKTNTADDCTWVLCNPSDRIRADTENFVRSMARKVMPSDASVEGYSADAKAVLWDFHGGKVGQRFVRARGIRESNKIPLKPTETRDKRIEVFTKYAEEYPYLFKYMHDDAGFRRLNFNIVKYETVRNSGRFDVIPAIDDVRPVFDLEDKYAHVVEAIHADEFDPVAAPAVDDEVADVVKEVVDMVALKAYQRRSRDRDPTRLARFVRYCEASGKAVADMPGHVEIDVTYVRKYGIRGRRYARGHSAQHITREARAVAFGHGCIDVDFQNCHPTILFNYVSAKGTGDVYRVLETYVRHPSTFRDFMAELYGEEVAASKKRILCLLFGGLPKDQNPLIWALFDDITRARDILLSDPEFEYLSDLFNDRPNPVATRFSYALSALEDSHLEHLLQQIRDNVPNVVIQTLMFDGVVLRIDQHGENDLRNVFEEFKGATGLLPVATRFTVVGAACESTNNRCLADALEHFGLDCSAMSDGPHMLADAMPTLAASGLGFQSVELNSESMDHGLYIVHANFHFLAAVVHVHGVVVMDGDHIEYFSVAEWKYVVADGHFTFVRIVNAAESSATCPVLLGGARKKLIAIRKVCDCGAKLWPDRELAAKLYSFAGISEVTHVTKRCHRRACRKRFGYNFVVANGNRTNAVFLREIQAIFVTYHVAFDLTYLKYHEELHYHGFLASRAAALAGHECLFNQNGSVRTFRRHYQNARFLRLVMQEMEQFHSKPLPFVIGDEVMESGLLKYDDYVHESIFPKQVDEDVREAVLDGHEKVLPRCRGPAPKRAGRPRASRAAKGFENGWFMALHPETGAVLSMCTMKNPENNDIAVQTTKRILQHYSSIDTIIYDRACRLLPSVKDRDDMKAVKYWVVDSFHAGRHRDGCPCNPKKVLRLKRRIAKVNTVVAEQYFSIFRNYARAVNELKPLRHKMLMLYYAQRHNADLVKARAKAAPAKRGIKRRPSTSYECE